MTDIKEKSNLPFEDSIGYRNEKGHDPDPIWITAYIETNQLFSALNDFLIDLCKKWGYSAITPTPAGMVDKEHIYSNWSQRHVAYAAGLGTFGLNNMLITDQGTCGRFYSLITNLPVEPDQPLREGRCLRKMCCWTAMYIQKSNAAEIKIAFLMS